MQCTYDSPWISESSRQSVEHYIKFIRPNSKDILENNYKECNHKMIGCTHNDCKVSFLYHYGDINHYLLESDDYRLLGPSELSWKIAFVSNTEVSLTPPTGDQYSSAEGTFTMQKIDYRKYTFKSKSNGMFMEANPENGALTLKSDVPNVQATFIVGIIGKTNQNILLLS